MNQHILDMIDSLHSFNTDFFRKGRDWPKYLQRYCKDTNQ